MAIYFQRYSGSEWINESESSSSGTSNHASLTNKDLASAGHTVTARGGSAENFDTFLQGLINVEDRVTLEDGSGWLITEADEYIIEEVVPFDTKIALDYDVGISLEDDSGVIIY